MADAKITYYVGLNCDSGSSSRGFTYEASTDAIVQFVEKHGGEYKGAFMRDMESFPDIAVICLHPKHLEALVECEFVKRLPFPGIHKDIFTEPLEIHECPYNNPNYFGAEGTCPEP